MRRSAVLPRYLAGLCATFAGAYAADAMHSMLPLALGASFSLLWTADVVRRILAAAKRSP